MLDDIAFLMAEFVHNGYNPVRTEKAHKIVLERNIKYRFSGIALPARPASKLAVDSSGFMSFRAENKEAALFAHAFAELDVCSTACHVCRDGHSAFLPCRSHNFSFPFMLFRVEYTVSDLFGPEHSREGFRYLDACRSNKDRLAFFLQVRDLVDDGRVLFLACLEDIVVLIVADHRLVCRDDDHIQLVDVKKLRRLRFGGACHSGKFFIEAEKVLDSDCRERLCFALDFDVFLCFDGLMEPVAVAPSGKYTAREFVDDHYLPVLYDIFIVLFEEGVCLEQLAYIMEFLRPFGKKPVNLIFFPDLFLGFESGVAFYCSHFSPDVRYKKEIAVLFAQRAEKVTSFIGQVYRTRFFIDREIQLVIDLVHSSCVIFQIVVFDALHELRHACLRKCFDEAAVFRLAAFCPQQSETGIETVRVYLDRFFRFVEIGGNQILLGLDQAFHPWFDFGELACVGVGYGSRYYQRGTGLVDKDAIDLIDYGVIVVALDKLVRRACHVISEIIEAELVVCAVGYIASVLFFPFFGAHSTQNDSGFQSMELKNRVHPLPVTLGEIVVHGHDVNASSCQGVEECR